SDQGIVTGHGGGDLLRFWSADHLKPDQIKTDLKPDHSWTRDKLNEALDKGATVDHVTDVDLVGEKKDMIVYSWLGKGKDNEIVFGASQLSLDNKFGRHIQAACLDSLHWPLSAATADGKLLATSGNKDMAVTVWESAGNAPVHYLVGKGRAATALGWL